MSDVEELLAAFSTGKLLRPSSKALNLVDLARAVASIAGAEGIEPTDGSASIMDIVGPVDHLVFVLVDGLGMNLLEKLPAGAFLPTRLAAELQTVFPSTTAVALTSIATSQWPSQHAITGWWTHLPQLDSAATILPYVKRSDGKSLNHHGVLVEKAFPASSVWGRTKRDTLALFPERIAGSVYSAYFCGGHARQGYRNFREAIDIVTQRVKDAGQPTYTYLYTNRIDDEAHRCGLSRPEVQAAVRDMDRELERLAAGIDHRARIVVTADHGFLDADKGERYQIRIADPLLDYLRFPPSGDARVLYLHLREGAHDQVRHYFRRRFNGQFWLLAVDEVEDLELFGPGPVAPEAKSRWGNLIAISKGRSVIEYRPPGNNGRIMEEASQHSGLTPAEMHVPLVVV